MFGLSARRVAAGAIFVAAATTVGTAQSAVVPFSDFTGFQIVAAGLSIPLTSDNLDFLGSAGPFPLIGRPGYTLSDPAAAPFNLSLVQANNSAFCAGGASPTTGCVTTTIGLNDLTRVFSFTGQTNAFGFFLIKSPASVIPLVVLNGIPVPGFYVPNGSLEIGFFGLIDDGAGFTSVTLSGITAGNLIGIDDVNFGARAAPSPVPLPAPFLLFALALGALGLGRWWRQRRLAAQ